MLLPRPRLFYCTFEYNESSIKIKGHEENGRREGGGEIDPKPKQPNTIAIITHLSYLDLHPYLYTCNTALKANNNQNHSTSYWEDFLGFLSFLIIYTASRKNVKEYPLHMITSTKTRLYKWNQLETIWQLLWIESPRL